MTERKLVSADSHVSLGPSVPAGASRTAAASGHEAPRDLRDWIHRAEAIGQLRRITEPVSRNEEMGAITYLAHQEIGAPALLFATTATTRSGTTSTGSACRGARACTRTPPPRVASP